MIEVAIEVAYLTSTVIFALVTGFLIGWFLSPGMWGDDDDDIDGG